MDVIKKGGKACVLSGESEPYISNGIRYALAISKKRGNPRSSLLDFPTHADFMVDTRMARTAQNVASFLQEVAQKLEILRSKECARLLELKREEVSQPCREMTVRLLDCVLGHILP
ncbi:hypothetical protein AHF37_08989 [Paragonimus kellicotti]|nr:hypothetical protein AHF37_08989 [Paragonimus kellicotti]